MAGRSRVEKMEEYREREKQLLRHLEDLTTRPGQVQEEILADILQKNGGTQYLQRHGLNGRIDKSSFQKCVPIISYEDIKDDIKMIADGDTSPILTSSPVIQFYKSSGTSGGEHKLFPKIAEDFHRTALFWSLIPPVLNRFVPDLDKGKAMYFFFVKQPGKTLGGLPAYAALSSYYSHPIFTERPYDPTNVFTSPDEVTLCTNTAQSTYCHLLCGLLNSSEVLKMGTIFAATFVRVIRALENYWPELCEDIRTGNLSGRISDSSVRTTVSKLLKPNPALADQIERECSLPSWEGIIRRLWPHTKLIDTVATGVMEQYASEIDYLSGGIPIVCSAYGASESYFGINMDPLCVTPSEVSYVLIPSMAYYEFLPVQRTGNLPEEELEGRSVAFIDSKIENAEDITSVKVGQRYEFVITTHSGLYRYRMGDVLEVTGFYNKAPKFAFVCRANVLLSIDVDKTDEKDLQLMILKASGVLQARGIRLRDYTSQADFSSKPGHYVIFVELDEGGGLLDDSGAEELCSSMEEGLPVVYKRGRQEGSIGPLEVRLVKHGTFLKLAEYAVSRGGSIAQFKTPRCIKNPALLDLMNGAVYQMSFSTTCPTYSP